MKNKLPLALIICGILLALVSIFADNLLGRPSDGYGKFQLTGIWIGMGIILIGLMITWFKGISTILFTLGVILIGINIFGMLSPLRNKEINKGVPWVFGDDRVPTVTYQNAIKELNRGDSESEENYARRLTNLIFSSTVHFWGKDEDENQAYNIILPFYENYLIYINSIVKNHGVQPYTFCNPDKAIERGVGVCYQMAQIVVSVWDPREKEAHMVTLDGHVVSEVKIKNNTWWFLDPDFGVVIDKSMKDIEANPEIVYSYYINRGYSKETALTVVNYYEKKGNYIVTNKGICKREQEFYRLIWIVPVLLITPFSLVVIINWAIKKYHNLKKV